jgi:hypothetical protein
VNAAKDRIARLALLDRTFRAIDDEQLVAAVAALPEDHRTTLNKVISSGGFDAADMPLSLRLAASKGRINGNLERIGLLLGDACLAQCIEKLGNRADMPSEGDLQEVLPGLIEAHGLGISRLMLASAIAAEAPASAIITHLLKNDPVVGLPAEVAPAPVVAAPVAVVDEAEREAVKARRKEEKAKKQAAANARLAQIKAAKRGRTAK